MSYDARLGNDYWRSFRAASTPSRLSEKTAGPRPAIVGIDAICGGCRCAIPPALLVANRGFTNPVDLYDQTAAIGALCDRSPSHGEDLKRTDFIGVEDLEEGDGLDKGFADHVGGFLRRYPSHSSVDL